jgi:hypothetical protein
MVSAPQGVMVPELLNVSVQWWVGEKHFRDRGAFAVIRRNEKARPARVVPKCKDDRSLAIAHGIEEVFWFEDDDGKWKPRKTPTRPISELVAERSSEAVKAALKSLLEAPDPTGHAKRGRKSKAA